MTRRTIEQLRQIVGNNRSVYDNVKNGIKAWDTRKKIMVEKAVSKGVNVDGFFNEYKLAKDHWENDLSKFGIIAKEVDKVKRSCFERWGDRNHIDRSLSANWFSFKANTMDCIAQELTDMYGVSIDPEDIAEFIIQYPDKDMYPKIVTLNTTIMRFKYLVGFHPKYYCKIIASKSVEGVPF